MRIRVMVLSVVLTACCISHIQAETVGLWSITRDQTNGNPGLAIIEATNRLAPAEHSTPDSFHVRCIETGMINVYVGTSGFWGYGGSGAKTRVIYNVHGKPKVEERWDVYSSGQLVGIPYTHTAKDLIMSLPSAGAITFTVYAREYGNNGTATFSLEGFAAIRKLLADGCKWP